MIKKKNAKGTGDTRLTTTRGTRTINTNLGATTNAITRITSAGNITGAATVLGNGVVLDSVTGVGATAGSRLATTATTLAARSTTSGGVFVSESDGVTLNTVNAVTNSAAGTHTYDGTPAGTISISA